MYPLRRLVHWGPLTSMTITASITVATASLKTNLIWILIFQLTMCLTLFHMWCSALIGPGFADVGSNNEVQNQQFQTFDSKELKPESNRFCRKCSHVVLRKHHHCPWINTCVGKYNEKYFLRFLYCAIAVTIQASAHLTIDIYQRNIIVLFNVFNIALSVGVLISVSVLLYTH